MKNDHQRDACTIIERLDTIVRRGWGSPLSAFGLMTPIGRDGFEQELFLSPAP